MGIQSVVSDIVNTLKELPSSFERCIGMNIIMFYALNDMYLVGLVIKELPFKYSQN